MKFYSLFVLLLIACFGQQIPAQYNKISKTSFEKIIWIYWNKPIQQAQIFIQLCAKQFEIMKQKLSFKSQWKLNILNDNNLQTYITNYTQYLYVLQNSQRNKIFYHQAKSDLIRLAVLSQHGGIWFDISTIIFNKFDLQWLQNLEKYSPYIINKYSNPQPEVLMFTFGFYQSTNLYVDQYFNLYNPYPGFCMWFIACAKGSQLIKQWKQVYYDWTIKGYKHYYQLMSKSDVYVRKIDLYRDYWSGNQALTYVIDKKQYELDRNTTLSNRKSVYDYYKLQYVNGELGPISASISVFQHAKYHSFYNSIQEIDKQFGETLFFYKYSRVLRGAIVENIENTVKRIQQSQQISKQTQKYAKQSSTLNKKPFSIIGYLILTQPTYQNCTQLYFIVNGSIIYQLYQTVSSKSKDFLIIKKIEKLLISIQQRNQWLSVCQKVKLKHKKQVSLNQPFIQYFFVQAYQSIKKCYSILQQFCFYDEELQMTTLTKTDFIRAVKSYKQHKITLFELGEIFINVHSYLLRFLMTTWCGLLILFTFIRYGFRRFSEKIRKIVLELATDVTQNRRRSIFYSFATNSSKNWILRSLFSIKKIKQKQMYQKPSEINSESNYQNSNDKDCISQKNLRLTKNLLSITTILLKLILITIGFSLKYFIYQYGLYPIDLLYFMYLILIALIDKLFIKSLIQINGSYSSQNQLRNKNKKINNLNQQLRFIFLICDYVIDFYLSYGIAAIFYQRKQYFCQYSILFGLAGPCLMKLLENAFCFQNKRQYSQSIIRSNKLLLCLVRMLIKINYKILSFSMLAIVIVFPNLKYITIQIIEHRYYLRHVIIAFCEFIFYCMVSVLAYQYYIYSCNTSQKTNNNKSQNRKQSQSSLPLLMMEQSSLYVNRTSQNKRSYKFFTLFRFLLYFLLFNQTFIQFDKSLNNFLLHTYWYICLSVFCFFFYLTHKLLEKQQFNRRSNEALTKNVINRQKDYQQNNKKENQQEEQNYQESQKLINL